MSVYLDYNASAPVDGRVIDYMVEVYRNNIGNADSRTHNYGENARNIVEEARKKVEASLVSQRTKFFLLVEQQRATTLQFKAYASMQLRQEESILLQLLLNTRQC